MKCLKVITASESDATNKNNHAAALNVPLDLQQLFPKLDSEMDRDGNNLSRDIDFIGPDGLGWTWRYLRRIREGRNTECRLVTTKDPDLPFRQRKLMSPRSILSHYQLESGDTLEFEKLSIDLIAMEITKKNEIDLVSQNASNHNRRGPKPRKSGYSVTEPDVGGAYVYIARYGSSDVYKVGMTILPKRRLREFNYYIPANELNFAAWTMQYVRYIRSADSAFELETSVLDYLSAVRTIGERFRCDPSMITTLVQHYKFSKYVG